MNIVSNPLGHRESPTRKFLRIILQANLTHPSPFKALSVPVWEDSYTALPGKDRRGWRDTGPDRVVLQQYSWRDTALSHIPTDITMKETIH